MARQNDGCLMRVGKTWGILLNSLIQPESRRNFTIGHELEHFQLDQDNQTDLPSAGNDMHGCTAYQFKEQRANQFAAELLMPAPIFQADVRALTGVGLSVIDTLADRYTTSLTSIAIRYTRLSQHVCAIVFSEKRPYQEIFLSSWRSQQQHLSPR